MFDPTDPTQVALSAWEQNSRETATTAALVSIACSLNRIADALDDCIDDGMLTAGILLGPKDYAKAREAMDIEQAIDEEIEGLEEE